MKKTLWIALAVVLGAALAVGVLFLILRANRKPAKVYAVEEIAMSDMGMGGQSVYGTVTMDRMQTVYLSQTQTVTELAVEPGQQVKQGDLLLRFDTTLTQLSLDRKELEIRQLERSLEKDKAEYNKLAGKTVYTAAAPTETGAKLILLGMDAPLRAPGTWDEVEDETEATDETDPTEEPETEAPTESTGEPDDGGVLSGEHADDVMDPPDPIQYWVSEYRIFSGSGTQDDPYIVVLAEGYEVCDLLLDEILKGADSAWIAFCTCGENRLYNPVTGTWGLYVMRAGTSWKYRLFDASGFVPSPLVELGETEKPAPEPEPPMSDDERKERMEELRQNIATNEIKLRMAEIELKQMKRELSDGAVYARFDGTVLTVNDPDEAFLAGVPVVKISGGGGYLISGAVSELRRDEIVVGQSVEMTSWETYESYTGTITEISDVPTTNNYWSDGNSNVSYYGFTVAVDGEADLREYETMEMQLVSDEGGTGIYLTDAFLLQENGKSYVFVRGADELLEKREVVTGRKLWGEYTEIVSGLGMEDFIAFPYAKSTEAGAKTEVGTQSELYGW